MSGATIGKRLLHVEQTTSHIIRVSRWFDLPLSEDEAKLCIAPFALDDDVEAHSLTHAIVELKLWSVAEGLQAWRILRRYGQSRFNRRVIAFGEFLFWRM